MATRPEGPYFGSVASEPLINTIKSANASRLEVVVGDSGAVLNVCIRDNGIGGANPRGPGPIRLRDTVAAIGGSMQIISPAGGGTTIQISMPIQQIDGEAAAWSCRAWLNPSDGPRFLNGMCCLQ
ncbi:hypothetical protein [Mycobacterium sp. URHB0021]